MNYIWTVSIINMIDSDADVWNSAFSSSEKALDFKIKADKWIEEHNLTGTLKVDMDSGRLDDESYLDMLEEEYGEGEEPEECWQDLTYTEAWGDVINFLRAQSEAWFLSCGRVKSDVLNDGILIDKIVGEHLRCVNNYGNDREWSVQDACTVDPGIRKE